jgi:hypothetical protein
LEIGYPAVSCWCFASKAVNLLSNSSII